MYIEISKLKKISFFYVILPVLCFFIGWIRWYFSIPLLICSCVILYFMCKNIPVKKVYFSKRVIITLLLIAFLWVFLSGIGKFFYQSEYFIDHFIKNSIFNDLIVEPWPVFYDANTSLCYYIGIWIIPAIIGKVALAATNNTIIAFTIGNISLFLWCLIGVILIFIWLLLLLKVSSFRKVLFLLLLFIFFSGLDIIGFIIVQGVPTPDNFLIGFEWWCGLKWQYSTFTSFLFYVYNQAIVPILISLVCFYDNDRKNSLTLCVFGLLFGPYAILGLGLYLFSKEIIHSILSRTIGGLKEYFSKQNLYSIIFILPIFLFYYMANNTVSQSKVLAGDPLVFDLKIYLLFIFLEFLLYVLLIIRKKNFWDLFLVTLFLCLFPLLGDMDFVMRTSIPIILVLFIYIVKFFLEDHSIFRKIILGFCLVIASINCFCDIGRGIYFTVKDKHIGSRIKEVPVLTLIDFRDFYISTGDSFFSRHILKRGNNKKFGFSEE